MSHSQKATIDDVAALAGVSIKTVSRVLNNEANVRQSTREKVNLAISRLDYRPNLSARRLAARRSYIVALLYDNPSANYLSNIQHGVVTACNASGYDVLVHPCDSTDPRLADEINHLREQGRCDGVILTPPLSDMSELVQSLEDKGTPFIQIAPAVRMDSCSWVATTDEAAGYQITDHLIRLGHRRIGYIQGHPDHKAMATREDGYKRALRAAGLKVDRKLIIAGFNSFESGEAAGRKLLGSTTPPSAIFAANDDMAAGVMKAARDLGLKIPEQLSVAGFDDTPVASQTWPELTTIHQPISEMAEAAAGILIERLDAQEYLQSKQVIDARLIIRQSTGPAPTA